MIKQAIRTFKNIVYLMPGDLIIAKNPAVIWTVLGSCVSIVFHNKRTGMSAICHAQMPEKRPFDHECYDDCPDPCRLETRDRERFRYVSCSINYMIEELGKLGIEKHEIQTSLYGGADVIESRLPQSIGSKNLETAKNMLASYGLKIQEEDTGGKKGRTLLFVSSTGTVTVEVHGSRSHKSPA